MTRRLPLVVWLVLVWLALWQQVSVANVLSGAGLAILLVTVFPFDPLAREGTLRPVAALRFCVYFLWKLVQASAVVAWEVVTPRNRIHEGIVAVPIRGLSDLVTVAVANAITLTPGTITVEIDRSPPVLYVHVLHLHDLDAVRRDVRHLEALAIRAFGGARALAALAEPEQPTGPPGGDPR